MYSLNEVGLKRRKVNDYFFKLLLFRTFVADYYNDCVLMKKVLSYSVLFVAIWGLIYFEGRYMIYIQEQTQLFQNDWYYLTDNISQTGGFASMLKEALVQFCHLPLLGSIILSLAALAAFACTASCIRTISGKAGHIELAGVAPLVPLLYSLMVCEDAYPLVTYAVTMAVASGVIKAGRKYSWIVAAAVSPLLFHACGAAALLLPLIVLVYGIAKGESAKERIFSVVPLAVYGIFGWISIITDHIAGTGEFLMYRIPFYESNAGADFSVPAMAAWAFALASVGAAYLISRISSRNIASLVTAIAIPVIAGITICLLPDKEYAANVGYGRYKDWAKLHYLYSTGRYDDLLDLYADNAPSTSVESNYINLALYRTGRLTTDFFRYSPGWMHQSLRAEWLDMQFPFPFIWVEVCDEMGALAKAHQSAFEGNILAGPRGSAPMMRYLAEAEIVRGNYKTAERYLDKLDDTVFYRKWARAQREFLSDQAVSSNEHYSVKRACYYDESRTLYDMNDLWLMKEVAANNPKHRSTYDYAGLMILAAGELNTFVDFMMEMTAAGVCQLPLPPVFQQAMAMAFAGNQNALNIYRIDPKLVDDYKEYSLAVNGKMKNGSMANAVISKNRDKYWHYLYGLMKANSSRK